MRQLKELLRKWFSRREIAQVWSVDCDGITKSSKWTVKERTASYIRLRRPSQAAPFGWHYEEMLVRVNDPDVIFCRR